MLDRRLYAGALRGVVALLTVFALAGAARAADPKAREAKAHFEEAQKHFAVGEFAQAGEEYQAAYKAKPDPALLYNAAQAFRLANQPDRALILYKNYVQFYPNEPNIDEVRSQIAKLKDAIAAADKAKSNPPTEVATPRPMEADKSPSTTNGTTTTPEPVKQEPVAAAAPAPATDHPAATPIYKKWWLWTIVGVVVVGAVVAVAVALTVPRGDWANGPTVGPGASALGVSSGAYARTARIVEVRW